MAPAQARLAVLAFDRLDVEKGMEVGGPAGRLRSLKRSLERHGLASRPPHVSPTFAVGGIGDS